MNTTACAGAYTRHGKIVSMSRGPRYKRKPDANHAEIRDALCDVPGVVVHDVSSLPGLGFDLIVAFRGGPPMFLEVKAGAGSSLTDSEREAADRWPGYWHIVNDFDDALGVLGIAP